MPAINVTRLRILTPEKTGSSHRASRKFNLSLIALMALNFYCAPTIPTSSPLSTPPPVPLYEGKILITSKMGIRYNPFGLEGEFHKGVDFAGKRGTPIVSVTNGMVTYSGYRPDGGGKSIIILGENGRTYIYSTLDTITVKAGESVSEGTKIGTMGSRGCGPHLHFEVYANDGQLLDPMATIDPVWFSYIDDLTEHPVVADE